MKRTLKMPRKSTRSNEPSTSRGGGRQKRPLDSSSEESDEPETDVSSFIAAAPSGEITVLANNMVKYLLNHSATKIPLKRAEISKNVNVTTKQFPEVFKICESKLENIYGLHVSEIQENKSSKVYIIHSSFESAVSALQFPLESRRETTLLFIILSYIFMKGGEVQECKLDNQQFTLLLLNRLSYLSAHLIQFLEQLNIDITEPHTTFGDVSKLIKETFPRQLYLKRTKVETEGVNEVQIHISWGARAEKEFDKKSVLQAVADIMNKSPATFINQYHEAHGEEPVGTQSVLIDED